MNNKRFMNINILGSNSSVTRNLGLVPISGAFTAERALETATDHLKLFDVDIKNIVAFTADGAAVMVKSQWGAKVQNLMAPSIYLLWYLSRAFSHDPRILGS